MLASGAIGRREFMGRALAAGATVAMASTLASGTLKAATPKKGGTLRIGLGHGSTTDTLDPATFTDTYTQFIGYAMRNQLIEVNHAGKLVPELAESWDASDDAAQWTFKLRKGVEFHNGKTMDAADVVASINHHRGEDSKSAAKGDLAAIVELKADGKDVVVFTLKEGNADFPYIATDYHLAIMPAKDGQIDWRSGVGTGGYTLESFEPGVRATLKRAPNYWKEGRAHFDGVEALSIKDKAARSSALTTGEIDAMDRVELKTAHLMARNKDLRIEETKGTLHYTFAMRTDQAPFDNNDVRLALKYGIDREALLKTIVRGRGVVGNDHPISEIDQYHASELPQRQYDPDKSKFHLKKAGLNSLSVDLSAAEAAYAEAVNAAVLNKEHAARSGIEINVIREPNDGYWDNVWLKKSFTAVFWSGRPTPDWMFTLAYSAGSNWNDTYWKHDRFNQLLLAARAELDQAKRREMYVEMQSIVSNEGGTIIPVFANWVFAMNKKVQHGEMAGNWDLDGAKAAERWWFA
jgi:peptide/nickel transport system substrate-binding protein